MAPEVKDAKYVTLTEENFHSEVLESSKPVLVDFWASWCGPCHMIAPAIAELASDYEGQATVGKLNVDEQPGIAERYAIRSIPSLLFFQNGEVVDHVVGAVPKKALVEKLKRLIPAA
jgi:thioredoxin